MKIAHNLSLLFWLSCYGAFVFAQSDSLNSSGKWFSKGYVKFLHTAYYLKPLDQIITDQLLHHRWNIRYYPHRHWTIRAEWRNRIFYGEVLKLNPDFAKQVDNVNNDYLDLSWVPVHHRQLVVHTMLDRLSLEYLKGNWEIRLGRQRVNWGIHTFWNANDIFNTFSFTDFDYEERPGSDAFSMRKYFSSSGSLELAIRAADRWSQTTAGMLWRFNRWRYDFQVLGGYTDPYAVGGIGWAGQIGSLGWKGEWSYFAFARDDQKDILTGSTGLDYVFSSGFFTQAGLFYNSAGSVNTPVSQLFQFKISPWSLYPYRWATYASAAYPFSPVINASLSLVYSPVNSHPLFFSPGLTISAASDWDVDLIGQILYNQERKFISPIQAFFLRVKYSY